MTDKQTYNIHFDHDLNITIDSNALDPEIKKELENMLNERENQFDNSTLPEINHAIQSHSFGFEVHLSTDEGKIEDIVKEHIQEQKELELEADKNFANALDNLNNQILKEFEQLEKGELTL